MFYCILVWLDVISTVGERTMQTKIIVDLCVDIVRYLDLEQLPANDDDDEADACQTNSCFANFV